MNRKLAWIYEEMDTHDDHYYEYKTWLLPSMIVAEHIFREHVSSMFFQGLLLNATARSQRKSVMRKLAGA